MMMITVITQKKKTLTFSDFKVCLRSYEETAYVLPSTAESNKVSYFSAHRLFCA